MVSIITKGFEYSHDIYELLRVLFPNEKIIETYDIGSYKDGYLVELSLISNKCTANLYYNDSLINSYEENFEDININRQVDKTLRVGIKKSLYNCLERGLNTHLPWGVLTGIRPGKIVDELFEKDTNLENIFNILTKEYRLNKENAKLIIDISKRQKDYIYPTDGGTPTSISIIYLEKIIQTVYQEFRGNLKEFTVEAGRPDTINKDVLLMLKNNNINRISINPQTMNDKTLKIIGRNHTSDDIIKAYDMTKDVGIPIINMDLIIGLPEEGLEEVKDTLNILERLDPENLTVHTLAVKRGSKYRENIDKFDKKILILSTI